MKLRKDVQVAGDGDQPGSPLKTLEAGTLDSSIPESELAQLSDEHFEGEPLSQVVPNQGATEYVFAFDRDSTIDTSMGPVPLVWVKKLAESYPTYAIGNQHLVQEADIPGIEHLRRVVGNLDDDDRAHVGHPARAQRLRMVEKMHPDAEKYIHIDDVDVGATEWGRWTHYLPQEFVDAVRSGELPLEVE